jgi:hypothetical protein
LGGCRNRLERVDARISAVRARVTTLHLSVRFCCEVVMVVRVNENYERRVVHILQYCSLSLTFTVVDWQVL